MFKKPTLVTLTAPTCAGKNYLLEELIKNGFDRIVSTTDRAARAGEVPGLHYFFIDTEESKRMEAAGELAELITYNGTRYGVTHDEMARKMMHAPHPPIVILEPQGLQIYREYCASKNWGIFSVFISTPEEVRLDRLVTRTASDIEQSLKTAAEPAFLIDLIAKHVKINNHRLRAIIEQERQWESTGNWDVRADGTDVEKALAQIKQAIVSFN